MRSKGVVDVFKVVIAIKVWDFSMWFLICMCTISDKITTKYASVTTRSLQHNFC